MPATRVFILVRESRILDLEENEQTNDGVQNTFRRLTTAY